MITANLRGGLGNQMFQIAAAYNIALENNDECAFNLTIINSDNCVFNLISYKGNVFKKIKDLSPLWEPEFNFYYDGCIYNPPPYFENMRIDGYFQSEKYFKKHKIEVIDLFTDRDIVSGIKNRYNFENSMAIHVRRGDYLHRPKIFPIPSVNYFKRGITFIDNKAQIDRIYVISDDIPWCKGNLTDGRMIFIEGNPDHIDLYIQSLCNHNIIANSSFSWWGSYLNENKDKIVYAPGVWVWNEEDYADRYYEGVYYEVSNIL
jgi:hypothetical protein